MDGSSDSVALRDVVIVGGGCYGSFYTGQLEAARRKGKVVYRRLLVVDRDPACAVARTSGEHREVVVRDWAEFFDEWLAADPESPGEPDAIVPSPLMPHLMYEWLLRRARDRWPGRAVQSRPLPVGPGTPYDRLAPDGTRYLSFADWLCPVHCIEPALCPVIRAPRTWEMGEALERLTGHLARTGPTEGPVLFECRHRVHGVGMFDRAAVLAGDRIVARAGAAHESVDVVVGTVSACHGAAGLLHLGP
ncbi:MAG TPA: hypothetical protein VEB59_15805 [Gemmatimonadales bacterium]|nr:hypothetical protein [Gemmatimonadales bacterium]